MKIFENFSPNFTKKTRTKEKIKFVIIHYTGMQSEIESVQRLKDPKFKVSCHYLINRNGAVTRLVKDTNISWHAGKSKWKKFNNLNYNSIGIELVNKGHQYGYESFRAKQINSLILLCKILKKKYGIKKENFLGHSDVAPLRKKDPGEKFPWKKLNFHNVGKWYKKERNLAKMSKEEMEIKFFKNLHKLGFRYFSLKKRNIKDKKVIISFQRHYLPKHVTGKLDRKTFEISHFLTK